MPRLITKFKYIKPGENAGKYAKYIATREGVEKIQTTYADYIAQRPRSSGLFSSALSGAKPVGSPFLSAR